MPREEIQCYSHTSSSRTKDIYLHIIIHNYARKECMRIIICNQNAPLYQQWKIKPNKAPWTNIKPGDFTREPREHALRSHRATELSLSPTASSSSSCSTNYPIQLVTMQLHTNWACLAQLVTFDKASNIWQSIILSSTIRRNSNKTLPTTSLCN